MWHLSSYLSRVAGTLLALAVVLPAQGQSVELPAATPAPATTAPDDAAIAALIRQLADPDYSVREMATQKLQAAGKPILPAIALAMKTAADPEVQSRLARIQTAITRQNLWNGTDTMAQYARRHDLPARRTVTLAQAPARVDMEFALIPAGEFTIGSPESEPGRLPGEVQHLVRLTKPFLMQRTPVTQAQWKALMPANPSRFKGDTLPVDSVTWTDAVKFCRALSAHDDRIYRLPTEAEWEFACRAGTTTPFYFGNAISPVTDANFNGNVHYGSGDADFRVTTTPVQTFRPNLWGLYDMHGNVWQWCGDWYGDYPPGDAVDPPGPAHGTTRVLRGGSWADVPLFLRSACREQTAPDESRIHIGFRVVQELP